MHHQHIFKVDDLSTYPEALKALFTEYLPILHEYFEDVEIYDYYDAHIAFDATVFLLNPKLDELFHRAWNILRDWKIYAYHNTRVTSVAEVKNHGLMLLEPDVYCKRMRDIFLGSPFASEMDSLLVRFDPFLSDVRGRRTGLLAFFVPYHLVHDYNKFVGNVGGEVSEFAFYNRLDVLGYLSDVGIPVTVEFTVPLTQIVSYRHEMILSELIRKFYCETQLNFEYWVGFDAATEHAIDPENILRVIPYEAQGV